MDMFLESLDIDIDNACVVEEHVGHGCKSPQLSVKLIGINAHGHPVSSIQTGPRASKDVDRLTT